MLASFSGFGEAGDEELAALDTAMQKTLRALRDSITGIRARIQRMTDEEWNPYYNAFATTYNFLYNTPASTRSAVLSGLATMDSVVARMDGTRLDVLAGLEAPEKWQRAAQTVAQGIEQQAAILNDDTYVRVFSPTFAELQDTAVRWRATAESLGRRIASFNLLSDMPWWGWVAGGVVSLGVVGYFLSAVAPFFPRRGR